MKSLAAVLYEINKPLELVELEVPALKPGQVLVEIRFSGVCHTQLLETKGAKGPDPFIPHCMGHEGAGLVVDKSPSVANFNPGDRVALSWIKGEGADVPGAIYSNNGQNVNAGAITTFMKYAVISENRLTKIPDHLNDNHAALLGCAIPTGFGVVLNTAQAVKDNSIAIFGVGGIGLCALMAAKYLGCSPIIAIDINPSKLDLAKHAGADITVNATTHDPLQSIYEYSKMGVNIAIEATGSPVVMATALSAVRPQGGIAVIVGNARSGESISLDPKQFNMGKQLRGTWGGESKPARDYNRYIEMMISGKINLDLLLSKTYRLTEINEALHDLDNGTVARPLIDMSL